MYALPLPRVLIKGAGDLASGVALRLHCCGFPIVLTELARPLAVRRAVAFGQAVYDGACVVEGVPARRAEADEVEALLATGVLPVLVEPPADIARRLNAQVLVDAILAKRNTGTHRHDAPLVIALGPGFVAGDNEGADCHAVIETQRGHRLGRVIRQGSAEPDTGVPGEVSGAAPQGAGASRVLRAPVAGRLHPRAEIGDSLQEGEALAWIETDSGERLPVVAPFAGILRGLIHADVPLTPGLKIGDLDARADREACFTVSDKSLSIAGGVLEAILSAYAHHGKLQPAVYP